MTFRELHALDLQVVTAFVQMVILLVVKGKVIPLQAWTGPEESRKLRLPDFKTIGT